MRLKFNNKYLLTLNKVKYFITFLFHLNISRLLLTYYLFKKAKSCLDYFFYCLLFYAWAGTFFYAIMQFQSNRVKKALSIF
ncbi:MAG: hypothetical protein ACI87I_001544 [Pseudoalteromonas tetraodonis]|jgi:hypothetical protein